MRAKCVFCEVETKCLSVIYANVSLHDVRITHVFLILVPPDSVCSVGFPDVDPSQSQQRSVSVKKFGITSLEGATFISKTSKHRFG